VRFFRKRVAAAVPVVVRPTSTIGMRAHWVCAGCRSAAVTHQIVTLSADGSMHGLDLPDGWGNFNGQTVCPHCEPVTGA
jgi:hypothetical protein